MNTERIDPKNIERAATLLRQGEVVAFPTETVYGLGASLFLEDAIKKIFEAKRRPSDNPLIAHICDLSFVDLIARDISPEFYHLAEAFFPGPLTVVLPKKKEVPLIATGGLDYVAIRMPKHPIARELIRLVGSPLVAPSANLSGKPSATTALHALEDFDGKIAGVVCGESSEIGIESTVVRWNEGRVEILRPGSIALEELESCLKRKVVFYQPKMEREAPVSPGLKYRHYAPKAKVFVCALEQKHLLLEKASSVKRMVLCNEPIDQNEVFPLTPFSFYSFLRKADAFGYEEIWIVCDPKTCADKGFMDRIEKSAGLSSGLFSFFK
jgi:L-threonylcarbamoyladenylate synthase